MIQFKIFSNHPFLVFRIDNNVYKFIDKENDIAEFDWLKFTFLFENFNIVNPVKLSIPYLELKEYFLEMEYVGSSLYDLTNEIYSFYDVLRSFSYFHQDKFGFTSSIGDAQLRNVYKSTEGFFLLDLGSRFGSRVSLFYDRARFLVHLIDSGFFLSSYLLLKNEPDRKIILSFMSQRSHYVFLKRLRKFAILSAFYRLFYFYFIYLKLIF